MHAGLVFFFNTDISLSRFDIFYDVNALGRTVNLSHVHD